MTLPVNIHEFETHLARRVEQAAKGHEFARVPKLPWVHRDPFGRILAVQAKEDGLSLLTAVAVL